MSHSSPTCPPSSPTCPPSSPTCPYSSPTGSHSIPSSRGGDLSDLFMAVSVYWSCMECQCLPLWEPVTRTGSVNASHQNQLPPSAALPEILGLSQTVVVNQEGLIKIPHSTNGCYSFLRYPKEPISVLCMLHGVLYSEGECPLFRGRVD